MNKIESRCAVELDELPPWDDTDASEHDDQVGSADVLPLTPYSFDSEQRTLVGIGPLERARRSRHAAPAPDSQRMPQSEPPGPFIADDDEEEVPPALQRGRKLGKPALAVSGVILVPLAAVGLMRSLSPHEGTSAELPRVAAAQVSRSASSAREPESQADVVRERDVARDGEQTQASEAPPVVDASPEHTTEQANVRSRTTAAPERRSTDAAPPTVRLAELPPTSTVVDRSNGDAEAGSIDIESTPPSNVVLDGRPLGKSPRVVRVSAGPHTVVFLHPLYGRRSLSVNVRSGAMTGASAEF